jgi:hypothetical protein
LRGHSPLLFQDVNLEPAKLRNPLSPVRLVVRQSQDWHLKSSTRFGVYNIFSYLS